MSLCHESSAIDPSISSLDLLQRNILSVWTVLLSRLQLAGTLLVFILITTCNTFAVRASRTHSTVAYSTALALLLIDLSKILLCFLLGGSVHREVDVKRLHITAVPAFLFTWQTQLLLFSAKYLDATVYQVLGQLKIATAAYFSWLILSRTFSVQQRIGLVLLVAGMSVVNLAKSVTADLAHPLATAAVIAASISSGLAGVLVERFLKQDKKSFLALNLELSMSSAGLSFFQFSADLLWNRSVYQHFGIFCGFTGFTIIVIFLQVVGGFVTGLILRSADSMIKSYAACFSLLLTCGIDMSLVSVTPSPNVLIGVMLVSISTLLYAEIAIERSMLCVVILFVAGDAIRDVIHLGESPL